MKVKYGTVLFPCCWSSIIIIALLLQMDIWQKIFLCRVTSEEYFLHICFQLQLLVLTLFLFQLLNWKYDVKALKYMKVTQNMAMVRSS